jgi:hypothetical protein
MFCAEANSDSEVVSLEKALELLAVLERPDALQPAVALRLGARLLAWTESRNSNFRCDEAPATCAPASDVLKEAAP